MPHKMAERSRLLRASLLAAVVLVPAIWIGLNAAKPVHVDDTLFLLWARTISPLPGESPVTLVNWDRFEEPMLDQTRSFAPGWAALLAVARRPAGGRVALLHWLQWPFAAAFLAGCVMLAQAFGISSWKLLALCSTSPLFLLPATTLMADLSCLGPALLGLGLWFRSSSWRARIAAVLLLGLAGQMKQTVLPLIPVLLVTPEGGLSRDRRVWAAAAAAFVLAGVYPPFPPHDPAGSSLMGRLLAVFQIGLKPALLEPKLGYALAALAAAAFFPALWPLATFIPGEKNMRAGIRACLIGALGIPLLSAAGFWRAGSFAYLGLLRAPASASTLWFFASIALFLAWAVLARPTWAHPRQRRLVVWMALGLLGSMTGTFFPAARFVIPLLPPLAVLLCSDLERRLGATARTRLIAIAAAGNLWLSLSLARADLLFAKFLQEAAGVGAGISSAHGIPLATTGSWGLRYYVERAGGPALGSSSESFPNGAILLEPSFADRRTTPIALRKRSKRTFTLSRPSALWPPFLPVRTIPPPYSTASFYGGYLWFPYAFSRSSLEWITFREVSPLHRGSRAPHRAH